MKTFVILQPVFCETNSDSVVHLGSVFVYLVSSLTFQLNRSG